MMSTPVSQSLSWVAIAQREPRLADLADTVANSTPPTREPGYGRCFTALMDLVEEIARPLGAEAFFVARNHLHCIFTSAALRATIQSQEENC